MKGRVMAVDPGEQRLGIAVSDPSGTIASPLTVIRHVARLVDAAAIVEIAKTHGAVLIVVGQALDSEGNPGPAARKASRRSLDRCRQPQAARQSARARSRSPHCRSGAGCLAAAPQEPGAPAPRTRDGACAGGGNAFPGTCLMVRAAGLDYGTVVRPPGSVWYTTVCRVAGSLKYTQVCGVLRASTSSGPYLRGRAAPP